MRKKYHNGTNSLNGLLFEPKSDWQHPTAFPDLSSAKRIGFDCETRDPRLTEHGPGFIRGDAEVVGIAIATDERGWYFPINHLAGGNMDRTSVINFVKAVCSVTDRWLIGANVQYDIEALWSLGIQVKGRVVDVQIAEALIDEESGQSYRLQNLCIKYLGSGKDESLLTEASQAFGVDAKSGLLKLHSKYVGPYAEYDAWSCIKIIEQQILEIDRQGLQEIFQLETELTPLLWEMRLLGIPVDLAAATSLSKELKRKEELLRMKLRDVMGFHVDEWSGVQLAQLCDKAKVNYPKTDKGNPSFVKAFLEESDNELLSSVAAIRELNRLRGTFVDDWIFSNQINGSIHPQWKQLKRDDGGTRTGRMAASNPNPQQVPTRSEIGEVIRKLFIAPAPLKWCKSDYSQQEPRILVHYASLCGLTGAAAVRDAYRNDSSMDIYQHLSESCSMTRRDAKDATLGRMYNMGFKTFAERQGCSVDEAKSKIEAFDSKVPFVKELANSVTNSAQSRGYIKTLRGRKRHFNLWEPADAFKLRRDEGVFCEPASRKLAEQTFPGKRLQRAYTHKALNSLIQGSAADMTKSAMLLIWKELKLVPYMQVHDEINYGVTDEKQAMQIKELCENCVKLEVPIKVDMHLGETWK